MELIHIRKWQYFRTNEQLKPSQKCEKLNKYPHQRKEKSKKEGRKEASLLLFSSKSLALRISTVLITNPTKNRPLNLKLTLKSDLGAGQRSTRGV